MSENIVDGSGEGQQASPSKEWLTRSKSSKVKTRHRVGVGNARIRTGQE
ncbi:hypothetical protein [Paraburkholderia steynii]|nr:hypothetical protein [Paraburkholderia steynii]